VPHGLLGLVRMLGLEGDHHVPLSAPGLKPTPSPGRNGPCVPRSIPGSVSAQKQI
jgi:hypothetical protein